MTCHVHRAALLDLARGVPMPSAVVRAAEAHAEDCPVCSAELARQQRLTEDFRALAEASQEWTAPAALDARLRQAFAARHQVVANVGRVRTPKWWMPAAAAVAASAILGVWLARDREQEPRLATAAAPLVEKTTTPGATRMPDRFGPPEPVPHVASAATRSAPPRRAARTDQARGIEFVLIPAAVGLPALESASIVRIELPLSVLPSYGLEILPEAKRSQVEADVLVGQDGQPRGIRLVPEHESVARSRQ
jgi:hypothetical protein